MDALERFRQAGYRAIGLDKDTYRYPKGAEMTVITANRVITKDISRLTYHHVRKDAAEQLEIIATKQVYLTLPSKMI